jgi:hypothetical protein
MIVNLITSDNKWFEQDQAIIQIIKSLSTEGAVTIETRGEGPDLAANNFFNVLDDICETFNFDKGQVLIVTSNHVQTHDKYKIEYMPFQWVHKLAATYPLKFSKELFLGKKTLNNLFGSFNNRPTWYRTCLVEHIRSLDILSLVSLNLSTESDNANTVDYNTLLSEVGLTEFAKVNEFLKNGAITLPVRALTYEEGFQATLTDLTSFYNDFFIDVIGNTFTTGITFYMDEKEARPIYCCTPFITYGAQGHLGNLHSIGFKTFNRWWDESYDNYSGNARLQKIKELLTSLSKLSALELQSMYAEMLPILEYNHNHLMENYGKE